MKKTRESKNINRNNNTLFKDVNHTSRINTIGPEVLVGSMWLQEDNPSRIQIIELHSSNSDASLKESQDYKNFSRAWSYNNNDPLQQQEDHYKINKRARERRRLKNNNQNLQPNSTLDTSNGYKTENIYPSFTSNYIDRDNVTLNHQTNCFTIINKHIIDSDTASDNPEYEDFEVLSPRDYLHESERWEANNRSYDDEIIINEPEHDLEKRTIWIYSFKNKHLLPDNDFKLENLYSKETTSCSTSCSIENIDEENTKDNTTSFRVATPIPAYVPRLNLIGPTLPTVSEITEPIKVTISESLTSMNNEVIKRKQNSWFLNDNKKVGSETTLKQDTSTNVVEWMGLSPRERRRRFKSSNVNEKLPSLPEVNSYAEALLKNFEQRHYKLKENELSQVEVDVDVHIADNDSKIESINTLNDALIETKVNFNDKIDKTPSEDKNPQSRKDDRGDHTRKDNFRRPQIRLSPKPKIYEAKISDPIDKLESDNWILEETEEKQTATYDYEDEEVKIDLPQTDENENSASRKLWKRNFSLMKPPEWTEYLPVGDSPLFLHLSLDSFDEIKPSWYKRIFKYFKCCTKDQS